ncbi:MAG: alcohol dehydrogenase, class [Herbinix sp.]|jgi:4-hydroxybutyrate dehydrogenase|nr:alcohol dehydrogenase, class [Herbinix sp.]
MEVIVKQFRLRTTIQIYDRFEEFLDTFLIGQDDLIITSGHIIEKYLKIKESEAKVINLRLFGTGEPTDGIVEAIYKEIKGIAYKRVIAIGGGSILDVAKLFVLENVSPVQELFERKLEVIKKKELVLVPTTCGTGSEVTNISILELSAKKTKLGLAVDELYADYAVLIPELLDTLSFVDFATSSIDAFIHAIESYLSPKANEFTELYSKIAMEKILKGYQTIAIEGEQARFPIMKDFLLASTYAGIAFGNAGCAAVHALSYPLGSVLHVAHGEANYTMFYAVFQKYQCLRPEGKIRELNYFLSQVIGSKESLVYKELDKLFSVILRKRSLREYGVSVSQIYEFSDSVLQNQKRLMANNYTTLNRTDVFEIYQSAY